MLSLKEQSARVRARNAQPVVIAGETFVPTAEFAARVGYRADHLHKIAAEFPVNNEVVKVRGWRFIRLPRHRGDTRSPIYWQVQP
jgi:hypothetical protein